MASPRLSVLLLLATLLFMLSCITSNAEEHPLSQRPTYANLVRKYRDRRAPQPMTGKTKELIKSSAQVASALLKVVADALNAPGVKEALGQIASFASLAPGIGTLVAAIINLALAFVPGADPVKDMLKDINQKLDSISKQIADLKTDVEWNTYASAYSRDETNIINSWNEFNKFRQSCEKEPNCENQKRELANKFVSFYENTATENSVARLVFYLTNTEASLSANLLHLLKKRHKCDIKELNRYNFFLNSLLWRGMVLNQLYYKLKGYDTEDKEAEYVSQFNKVIEAQRDVVASCADSEEYIEPAVQKINQIHPLKPDEESATKVKEELDKTYDFYYWIVVIFKSNDKEKHSLLHFTSVNLGDITVAVSRTNSKWNEDIFTSENPNYLRGILEKKKCSNLEQELSRDNGPVDKWEMDYLRLIFAALLVSKGKVFAAPEAFISGKCNSVPAKLHFYFYAKLPHSPNAPWDPCGNFGCENGAKCRWLAGTLTMCECQPGYHGDKCQNAVSVTRKDLEVVLDKPVPSITTIDEKLIKMDTKIYKVHTRLYRLETQLTKMDTQLAEISSNLNKIYKLLERPTADKSQQQPEN
ncbi:uncharacterized protein LOC115370401 [Myripristis murdjan]|uniref:uncharacterized protein LOC115370401 n=1 Tax=Myripristis murdjan TaxID=586833 RepID=UPI0011761E89|nr:uncharacterized protein LOC115370401 [Myripristis murdjan]